MANLKLRDRVESYVKSSDHQLLSRVPIIICVNGRSFSKTTSLIDKPFCKNFSEIMVSTMLKLCHEIDGSIFGFTFNDEIIIIARNDQNIETTAWYDNKIQKICSAASSIATMYFNKASESLNLLGDNIFITQVFPVPTISEAANTIIYKQQENFFISVQYACIYELLKKYNKNVIGDMLTGLSIDDKIDLLEEECNVKFDMYPISFRRGVAAYKIPTVINGQMKNKWHINYDLPIFSKNQEFLSNIFKTGQDIFRKENMI